MFKRSLLLVALVCFFLSGYALAHVHGQELAAQNLGIISQDDAIPTNCTPDKGDCIASFLPVFVYPTPQPKFDVKPVLAYGLSQAADIWSTHRFLTNGSGCVEGNPWMFGTSNPSDAQLVAGLALSVGIMAGYSYGLYRLGRVTGHPLLFRRLAQGVGYGGAVYEVGITLKNLRACP